MISQDTNRMREIDRGQCYAVGWTSYAGAKQEYLYDSDDDDDDEEEEAEDAKAKDQLMLASKFSLEAKKPHSDVDKTDTKETEKEDKVSPQKKENAEAITLSVSETIDKNEKKSVQEEVVEEKREGEDKLEDQQEDTASKHSNGGDNTDTTYTKPETSQRTPKPKEGFLETVEQTIDMCTFITPCKLVTQGKDKKSHFFKKSKDKTGGGAGIVPSMMLMKDFHSVENAAQPTNIVSPTGCPDEFSHLFGGGPLLCITSKLIAKDATTSNAVSQIELDAAAQSEEASRGSTTSGKVNEDIVEIPPFATHKSQFYYLSIDELSEKKNVADKFVLTPMGPPMAAVTMITWDSPQTTQFTSDGADIFTQKVAVLIHNRINILVLKGVTTEATGRQNRTRSRSSSKYKKQSSMSVLFSAAPVLDKISLTCLASCQVGALPYDTPTGLFWDQGTLFASSPCAVHVVFPMTQTANRKDKNDESGGARENNGDHNNMDQENNFQNSFHADRTPQHGHLIQWGGNLADSFVVSSLHALVPSNSWHTNNLSPGQQANNLLPQMLPMPYGHVEVIGVLKGYLLLAMRDTSVAAVPLTASPMVGLMPLTFLSDHCNPSRSGFGSGS